MIPTLVRPVRARVAIAAALAAGALLGALAAGAPAAAAQSLPPVTRSKAAATRAAAATDSHTRAVTQPAEPAAPSQGAQGAQRTPPRGAQAPAGQPRDTARAGGDVTRPGAARPEAEDSQMTLRREVFQYDGGARRDPFVSLLNTAELRPMLSDLRLVAVLYDPAGRSVAILRDLTTKDQYRLRVGQTIGRMRVTRISPKAVTFTILEFGESRQETLELTDTTRVRTP